MSSGRFARMKAWNVAEADPTVTLDVRQKGRLKSDVGTEREK
jgi:hypothetical protein